MKINVGDRIRFRSPCRWSDRIVWRKVKRIGIDHVTVRFGWPDFQVRLHEIIEIEDQDGRRTVYTGGD